MQKASRAVLVSIAAILACFLFFGCVTVQNPTASPAASQDADAAAKNFVPPDGMSNLYIVRAKDSFGQVEPYLTEVDGRMIGYLAPGMFFLVSVSPGPHEVSVAGRGGLDRAQVSTSPDKNYYFQVKTSSPPPPTSSSSSSYSAQQDKPFIGIMIIESLSRMTVKQSRLAQGSTP